MTVVAVVVGLASAALATVALLAIVRPVMSLRMTWPAVGAAAAGAAVTITVGLLTHAAPLPYLVGISAFAVPVLVLLEAATLISGADRLARWVFLLIWAVIVFPAAALVPLIATAGCGGTDCELQDFGGALPLLVSSSAFVVFAWLPAGMVETFRPDHVTAVRAVAGILLLWLAYVIWLADLEGAVDDYTVRILFAAGVGPVAAAVGWLVVDLARRVQRPPTRSLAFGLLAGMAATIPGAVTVAFPWSAIVGVLAGVIGAGVASSRAVSRAAFATRWGLVVLIATAVGFLAPSISGDTVGILFSGELDVLEVPVISFAAVTVFSLVVSAPAWILLRRHAARARIPAAIVSDE